jgi:hypothetical protein
MSPETIAIYAPSAPTSQSYTVGDSFALQVITNFTENSIVCTQNDIIYSMIATPANSSKSVDFISFTPSNMTVLWQSNSNEQAGNYTIEITGTISAATIWRQSV